MILLPPRSTRTDTLFPYTTLFRSVEIGAPGIVAALDIGGAHARLDIPQLAGAVGGEEFDPRAVAPLFGEHPRLAAEIADDRRARRDRVAHHHPIALGGRLDLDRDLEHVAARQHALLALADHRDLALDLIACRQRPGQRQI